MRVRLPPTARTAWQATTQQCRAQQYHAADVTVAAWPAMGQGIVGTVLMIDMWMGLASVCNVYTPAWHATLVHTACHARYHILVMVRVPVQPVGLAVWHAIHHHTAYHVVPATTWILWLIRVSSVSYWPQLLIVCSALIPVAWDARSDSTKQELYHVWIALLLW